MSSRTASRKVSRTSSRKVSDSVSLPQQSVMPVIVTSLVVILYNLLVVGYIITLEGQQCGCVRDWRHDFIKYYSGALICYGVMLLILAGTSYRNSVVVKVCQNALMLLSFVNVWCLYTYVGDLDKTYCRCAIEKQKNMHYFLYLWRYILVASIVASLIMIIVSALYQ